MRERDEVICLREIQIYFTEIMAQFTFHLLPFYVILFHFLRAGNVLSILYHLDNGTKCHYYMNHSFKLVNLKKKKNQYFGNKCALQVKHASLINNTEIKK